MSKATATCSSTYLLKTAAVFLINVVNAPSSKALGVILGICPLTHGSDQADLHSVSCSLYASLNPAFPTSAKCQTFLQFTKQYSVTCRYWMGEPFYWVYSKCN
eukprot:7948905-Ditylum_brightwellii.AAC.1